MPSLPFKLSLSVVLAAALLGCWGCTQTPRGQPSAFEAANEQGGAELWARSCRRCHNLRPATSYSADQWEVVTNHMRIRAGLSAKDARKIEEFLKAAN